MTRRLRGVRDLTISELWAAFYALQAYTALKDKERRAVGRAKRKINDELSIRRRTAIVHKAILDRKNRRPKSIMFEGRPLGSAESHTYNLAYDGAIAI